MMLNCPGLDQWHTGVPRSVRLPIVMGLVVLVGWGLGFGLWATFAPLEGAVVAPATFVATGQNKQIQHLEGGIARDILVKEGDLVTPGQVLMRLDETAPKARHRRLQVRFHRLLAMQVRLLAETRLTRELELSEALREAARDPEVAAIIERQRNEYAARRDKLQAEIDVYAKEIAALEEGIAGFRTQIAASELQLKLFAEELADKGLLLQQALIKKSELLNLKRSEARLTGEIGQLQGRIGDSNERIARARQQVASLHSAQVQRASEELRGVETEIDDVREQLRAARDVVERVEVTAPVRGIVVKLNHHTAGGVVPAGGTILELLPVNDELILELRINPVDISHVREGQPALVRLTALNQRVTPTVAGRVTYVSADAVTGADPRKSVLSAATASYVARVQLEDRDVRVKAPDFRPTPGMPAEIFIKTADRTFFDYLLRPVLDSFTRAFREP